MGMAEFDGETVAGPCAKPSKPVDSARTARHFQSIVPSIVIVEAKILADPKIAGFTTIAEITGARLRQSASLLPLVARFDNGAQVPFEGSSGTGVIP
jgi:hypothetical protein